MDLTIPRAVAQPACVESIDGLLRAADSFTELELLGGSRCYGWSRMDVLVHVLAGWQEMLGGLVSVVGCDVAPTVDAASYWTAFAAEYGGSDEVAQLMGQRRRTAAFLRPSSLLAQLHDVGAALRAGVLACDDAPRRWQGHVFTAGDFLAVWAVEHAVHHLDLLSSPPVSGGPLALGRRTVEALIEAELPEEWSDTDAVLIGTGRAPLPDDVQGRPWAARLPALS